MRRPVTKKRLKTWDHKTFTAKALPGSESFYKTSGRSKDRGRECEQQALNHFLQKKYQLIGRNQKVCGVEVDLILKKQHLTLVEVKAVRDFDEIHFRVSPQQRQRLGFVVQYLRQSSDVVELKFAFVCRREVLIVGEEAFF